MSHAVALLDELDGALEDREVGETEEVHLHQADRGDVLHGVLRRRHRCCVAARRARQRHVLYQRLARDDDAGGVGAGVARDAFELLRLVDEAADLRVLLVDVAQLRRLVHARGRASCAAAFGIEARDAVDVGVGHAQRAADVADGGLGAQRAEGDDLRHAVGAVAVRRRSGALPRGGRPGCRSRRPAPPGARC